MRVAFLGKGGSGKTTMTTSFIKYLVKKQKRVVAIDADINVHLEKALNMKAPFLSEMYNEITGYLEEENAKNKAPLIGSFPVSSKSTFIKPNFEDPFFEKFAKVNGNLALLTVGTYTEKGIGGTCYHGKLGNLILVYNRLLDNQNMYVISDMTAGVDSVATSMFCASDINIFVVEPTLKSISVLDDYKKITKKYKMQIYVIANKINNQKDIDFIKKNVDEKIIIGYINASKNLKKYEQGNEESFLDFEQEVDNVNEKILEIMNNSKRDWNEVLKINHILFNQEGKKWYNDYYNEDISRYIDKSFNYEEVID